MKLTPICDHLNDEQSDKTRKIILQVRVSREGEWIQEVNTLGAEEGLAHFYNIANPNISSRQDKQ